MKLISIHVLSSTQHYSPQKVPRAPPQREEIKDSEDDWPLCSKTSPQSHSEDTKSHVIGFHHKEGILLYEEAFFSLSNHVFDFWKIKMFLLDFFRLSLINSESRTHYLYCAGHLVLPLWPTAGPLGFLVSPCAVGDWVGGAFHHPPYTQSIFICLVLNYTQKTTQSAWVWCVLYVTSTLSDFVIIFFQWAKMFDSSVKRPDLYKIQLVGIHWNKNAVTLVVRSFRAEWKLSYSTVACSVCCLELLLTHLLFRNSVGE